MTSFQLPHIGNKARKVDEACTLYQDTPDCTLVIDKAVHDVKCSQLELTPPQHREPFTDPDFPPADKSLYINPKFPITRWKVAQWLRPRDIVDEHSSPSVEWAVSRNPGPDDIAQGVLGNCW